MSKVAEKVDRLERMMEHLAFLNQETQISLQKLSKEIQEFKEWSKQNIAEIRKESERFRKEMEEFKEWTKQNIAEIRKESERFHNEMEEFKEWSKQNIAEIRENSKKFEEWSKQNIRDLNKKWGELANKLGTVVEDIIAPALIEASKKYFGCDKEPDDFMVRRRKKNVKDKSKVREFDLIIVCGDNVIINETKTTPKPEYVEGFYNFIRSEEIFEYFPEYKG